LITFAYFSYVVVVSAVWRTPRLQSGMQPGFRKPYVTYALTAEAEQIFPKWYGVLLDLIFIVISRQVSPKELRGAMREVGKRVAANHLLEVKGKSRNKRIEAALRILKDLGGSATFEKREGKHFIRGDGCPLVAATSRHPEACLIAETLLSEIIGASAKQCCIHGSTPRVVSKSVDPATPVDVHVSPVVRSRDDYRVRIKAPLVYSVYNRAAAAFCLSATAALPRRS
jgi:hypothetical protein